MGGTTISKINRVHLVLLASVFVLGAFYLYLASTIAQDHFTLQSMTVDIQELRDKNSFIETEAARGQSLDNLELRSYALNLEEVKHVSYIEVKDPSPLVFTNE